MKLKYILIPLLLASVASCKKSFLEAKPDKHLVVPSTLQDFQALLDNTTTMNSWMPYLGEISSDDYYLQDATWNSLTNPIEKNGYIWAKEIFEGYPSADWENMYRIVFYANNVLEGLEKLKSTEDSQSYAEIKGSALFFRGYAFYQLSQLFCAPYSATTSNNGLGIPLRLKSDINLPTVRSTIAQTYSQIYQDLSASVALLPSNVAIKTRPCKAAAYAMLSKMNIIMQQYDAALLYADSTLAQPGYELIDLNDVDTSAKYPMAQYNQEVIFQTTLNYIGNLAFSRINIDSVLYRSYVENDLRKAAWFTMSKGHIVFKGNYNGSSNYLFSGPGLNEVYLNKAECLARTEQITEAMMVLNTLLKKRFQTGTFMPFSATSTKEALGIILQERRKELLFRGVRWSDLRRLNLEPATAETLHRVIDGKSYELLPNSLNYVFPIEDKVIELSGIEQNPRN